MKDENIIFTIITVCFNSEKTIQFTLESVLNQTFNNFEYIIIDGNSTDSTLSIIKNFEKKFFKKNISFRWISERDKGIFDAMNKGVMLSSGKLIGIINSDDWYELDALDNINTQLLKSNADFIHGNMNLYSHEKKLIRTMKPKGENVVNRKMPFFHPTSFISKKIYNRLNGYSLKYSICSDYDFIIKILQSDYKISYINKVITNFTLGGVSTTQVQKALQESHKIRLDNNYNRFVSGFYYLLETVICKIKYR